jgi:polyhydroxyalkanoate synthesis regulator phasin
MKIEMSLEQARALVSDVVLHRKRWGKYAAAPYTQAQLYDSLVLLHDAGIITGEATPEEVTKLRRQLAACQNRELARKKKEAEQSENQDD